MTSSKTIDTLTRILEGIVTVFFLVILGLTIILVILRYVFNEAIIGGPELMEYLFIYTTALGAAVSLGRRDHIAIDYFVNKLPGTVRSIVVAFGFVLVAFINIVIFRLSFPWIAKVGGAESPVMRIPMWSAQISVPIGCALAVLYCIYNIWQEIEGIRSRRRGATS